MFSLFMCYQTAGGGVSTPPLDLHQPGGGVARCRDVQREESREKLVKSKLKLPSEKQQEENIV